MAAIKRYMETQRPYASYVPDNMDFAAKNNGLEKQDVKENLLTAKLMVVSVGFFAALPLCLDRITSADQALAILEAMKLGNKLHAGENAVGGTVEKVLVREGEVVVAGAGLMLVRKG